MRYAPERSGTVNTKLTQFFEGILGALGYLHSNRMATLAKEARRLCRRVVTKVLTCNATRPLRQVSSSYSLLLPCYLLACCISSCHHLHSIIMFFKNLHSSGFSEFSPLFVLSPTTLARACGMSEIVYYKWPENVLGLG